MTDTKRITLGPRETQLLFALESRQADLFTPREAARILRVPVGVASDVIYRLRGKGRVIDVRKGEYLLVPARAGIGAGWSESIFRTVDAVVREGYYVGFWSAMNYWGMTEQVPRVVHVVTANRRRPFRFQGQRVQFVTMRPDRIFGATQESAGRGSFSISDRERTLVDALLLPRYCGGVGEAAKALAETGRELRWERLGAYVRRLGVDAVTRRLGYLLELLDLQAPLRRRLRREFRGFRWLDPSAPRQRLGYSKEWGLILNVTQEELLPPGRP